MNRFQAMPHPFTIRLLGRVARQRGITLVDFMVGITLGLLVVLAALGSLTMTRSSAHVMNDSAGLEQQASLVMMQIGRQISQAGAVNAYRAGTDPNLGIASSAPAASAAAGSGKILFDTRDLGKDKDKNKGDPTAATIFGDVDKAGFDTFTISYAVPNDYDSKEQPRNCIGNKPPETVPSGTIPSIVNVFSINKAADGSSLRCGDGVNPPQPIARNVVDMQVWYLTVNNDTVASLRAQQVTDWKQVSGLQICLEMQGDATQAPRPSSEAKDCRGKPFSNDDGRIHRIVRQTFYLRNA